MRSSFTLRLKALFERGECDVILTTEDGLGPGGEKLVSQPLGWVGAPGAVAWKRRPLRLAFEQKGLFRPGILRTLDAAGIPWEMAVETENSRAIEASVSADMAIHTTLEGNCAAQREPIDHGSALPEPLHKNINFYARPDASPQMEALARLVGHACRCGISGRNHNLAG